MKTYPYAVIANKIKMFYSSFYFTFNPMRPVLIILQHFVFDTNVCR